MILFRSQWDMDGNQRRNDCGPACVAMVLASVGQDVPINTLSQIDIGDDGTTAAELIALLAKHDVIAHQTAMRTAPAICLVKYSGFRRSNVQDVNFTGWHWLILLSIDASRVTVHDPDWWGSRRNEGSNKAYSRAEWDAAFIPYGSARIAVVWDGGSELPKDEDDMVKATVTSDMPFLRVRQGAGTSTPAVAYLKNGAQIEVDTSGAAKNKLGQTWYPVSFQNSPGVLYGDEALTRPVTVQGYVMAGLVTLPKVDPQPVKPKLGFNFLFNGWAGGAAYSDGCRFFLAMNDTEGANALAAKGDAMVMYRQWWEHCPSQAELYNALNVGRLHKKILRTGPNELYGFDGSDIAFHAALDIDIATRLKRDDPDVIYAAGTFPMGTPDFTSAKVCADIKQYYAPAYNAGLIWWDHHLYSPTKDWIYKGMPAAAVTDMWNGAYASQPHIQSGPVGRDGHVATWMDDNVTGVVASAEHHLLAAASFTDTPNYQSWFERRWEFLFTRCGFDPKVRHIVSGECGLDEGGVGGFLAHGMSAAEVAAYCRRWIDLQSLPLVVNGISYPSPMVGGAIYQLGDTSTADGHWGGYAMDSYLATLKNAGVY